MVDVTLIDLIDIPDKWQKLMFHIANRPETVVRCSFIDAKTAGLGARRMMAARGNRLSWFRDLLITTRGADVYVVKVGKAKKVVVRL